MSKTRGKKGNPSWRRKLRFTREGRVFVVVTLGVGAAAINTGNNLLFLVLGLLLSLIVLSGMLSERVIRHLRIRRLLPRRSFANAPTLIELEVKKFGGRFPSFSFEVQEAELSEQTSPCYFLKLAPGESEISAFTYRPVKRGLHRLDGFDVRTRFPFGFFEKSRTLEVPNEILVYPEIGEALALPMISASGPDVPSSQIGRGLEVIGVREHRAEDEARSIHWRRTASLGKLVVRERARDTRSHISLVIDNAKPEMTGTQWDAAFERVISNVAATALHALSRGMSVDVCSRAGRSARSAPGGSGEEVLAFLALLEAQPSESADAMPQLVGSVQTFRVEPEVMSP